MVEILFIINKVLNYKWNTQLFSHRNTFSPLELKEFGRTNPKSSLQFQHMPFKSVFTLPSPPPQLMHKWRRQEEEQGWSGKNKVI